MIHVSPAGARAVMRRKGNFGSLACIEFVFPWHCNPRGVLLLGSTGNTCVTHTCLAQGKGAPLSRGCCRLPLGNVSFKGMLRRVLSLSRRWPVAADLSLSCRP